MTNSEWCPADFESRQRAIRPKEPGAHVERQLSLGGKQAELAAKGWKGRVRERYHQQTWEEPLIYDLGSPGERGILPPVIDSTVRAEVGDPVALVPAGMLRTDPPALPQVAQPQIMRHYTRLSQELLAEDSAILLSQGTCSMKYSSKVNERLVNMEEHLELHPRQDEDTVQGILEVLYQFSECLKAISGLDGVSLQPASGSQGVFSNARTIRRYHEDSGLGLDQKDEVVTTIFSHPCCPAIPHMAGYKVITVYPDDTGYGSLDKFKAAINERTAALQICCPDDTGILHPQIDKICELVHEAGGLAVLDAANANGFFGWYKAADAGFDMVHWNLHKSFSSPHGTGGPGGGPVAVSKALEKYLPVPVPAYDATNDRYYLDWDRPHSIGKVRSFYGNIGVILRSYAWLMSLGPDGLRTVSDIAVLNNNYLRKLFAEIRGVAMWYTEPRRMHEIRWSFEQLQKETGVGVVEVGSRLSDYGIGAPFFSHHPWIVPEPMTPEPTETYSKAEVEEFAAVVNRVCEEAYSDPDLVKSAPHKSAWGLMDYGVPADFSGLATSRRAFLNRCQDVAAD